MFTFTNIIKIKQSLEKLTNFKIPFYIQPPLNIHTYIHTNSKTPLCVVIMLFLKYYGAYTPKAIRATNSRATPLFCSAVN